MVLYDDGTGSDDPIHYVPIYEYSHDQSHTIKRFDVIYRYGDNVLLEFVAGSQAATYTRTFDSYSVVTSEFLYAGAKLYVDNQNKLHIIDSTSGYQDVITGNFKAPTNPKWYM